MAGAAIGIGMLGAVALGGLIAKRKASPRSADDAPGYTARRSFGAYDVVGRTVTIREDRHKLFAFWRDFSNLPDVMENVVSITPRSSDGRAVWKIRAPAGRIVEIETEIAREIEGEVIAWCSVEGSDIETKGRVEFADAPGDRGTRVTLITAYDPPGGAVGKGLAKLWLREPAVQARHDLKRFKALMETGEITTSARTMDETRAAKMENTR
ncbi:cyclase [Novosphingobium marinum]|nr:cyclase [Novosphingobium marinum]